MCDLNNIGKIIGKSINYYRNNAKRMRYGYNCDITVAIYDNHYFIIKDIENPTEAYKFVVKNISWSEKTIKNLEV